MSNSTTLFTSLSRKGEGGRTNLLLNFLAALFLAGALVMLGQSSWIQLKAEVAQVLLQRAFERSIASGRPEKPWNWADTWPVARIRIARIGAEAIVLHGATAEALAFGPSLLPGTPMPGERGTAVISAHRDTHFNFLKQVKTGDEISITRSDGLTFQYRVSNLRVAAWNASGIDRFAPGYRLALTTCWPFDGLRRGNLRYIVEAEMVR